MNETLDCLAEDSSFFTCCISNNNHPSSIDYVEIDSDIGPIGSCSLCLQKDI